MTRPDQLDAAIDAAIAKREAITLIERLRNLDYANPLSQEAADLIEQQAERIKELEAELERERIRLAVCGSAALGYFERCDDKYHSASLDDVLRLRERLAACDTVITDANNMLADLRQRIINAPVVAWKHGEYLFNAHCHDERFLSAEGIALINREDLRQ